MSERTVLCLGDVMVDVVARLSGALATGSDTRAETTLQGGGSAANTACWLDDAGADVALVGRVGDDLFGRWSLERLGPRVGRLVSVAAGVPTGTCVVLVGVDGERTMIPDPGANATLRPHHLHEADFAGAHLHVSGYALFGDARIAALRALALARAAGLSISVGAASSQPLRSLGADTFLGLVGTGVLVVANAAEAAVLTGRNDIEAAARELSRRAGEAVVTDAGNGAVWCAGEILVRQHADPIEVLDSTGAGDAFAAGLLAARVAGADRVEALGAAAELAARACATVGARPPVQHPTQP